MQVYFEFSTPIQKPNEITQNSNIQQRSVIVDICCNTPEPEFASVICTEFDTLMYKCINSIAANYLSDNVLMQDIFNQRSTRTTNQCMVVIPQPRTEIFKQSFAYKGAVLWNMLPLYPNLNTATSTHLIHI